MQRTLAALVLLAVLALAAQPAGAQERPSFSESYIARAGIGDIPTTNAAETAGVLNLVQSFRFTHTNGTATSVVLHVPAGHQLTATACDCGAPPAIADREVTFSVPADQPTGSLVANITSFQAVGQAYATTLELPDGAAGDARLILFTVAGRNVDANVDLTEVGTVTNDPGTTIHNSDGDLPGTVWFSVHPAAADSTEGGDSGNATAPWLPAALGFFAGMVVWALLVSRGVVQKRSRKQEVQVAAHVEAAKEPVPVLEAKKRALMAGLKDLELAKMNNEVPADAYDAAKADLKRQTVTVMRAIETAAADEKK